VTTYWMRAGEAVSKLAAYFRLHERETRGQVSEWDSPAACIAPTSASCGGAGAHGRQLTCTFYCMAIAVVFTGVGKRRDAESRSAGGGRAERCARRRAD
jgi:hypothetical protein